MSTLERMVDPSLATVRRVEVISGTGARRRWSLDEKALVVEETLAPGAIVSEIARRHGLSPQQLFTWRRDARRRSTKDGAPPFVRAMLDVKDAEPQGSPGEPTPAMEINIDGAHIWIWRGVDADLAAAVVRALKGAK